MTAPQPLTNRIQKPTPNVASPSARPQTKPIQTPAALQDMLCTWVPGTTSIVRLKIGTEPGRERTLEVTSTHLSRIFGKEVVHDLYLKGRSKVMVTDQQLALLT
ncbi:hypothetical protein [Deinococcus marmoris]|uniref:Uncharacterized protein n=1 Tax=Deinococcus marmoris TaxID=249408 RepID=A0A1U7NRQ0_9DEIO|nr:hypothetical protein [Deinococcus marmoris]OLV15594.1 hypothetical protein BOO71_0014383 [Deinococcus marmoris]